MQSPLANPDDKAAKASRVLRIMKMNLRTLQPIAEYAYLTDDATKYSAIDQYDIVISDIYAINADQLLVGERDKNTGDRAQIKKITHINLKEATNLLGKFDGVTNGKTLEQMNAEELEAVGIQTPEKHTVIDLVQYKYPFEKIEGLTMIAPDKIAIVNDNDFGIENTMQKGIPTELWMFKRNRPNKKEILDGVIHP